MQNSHPCIRVSASTDVNLCIIQKDTNFTHFASKILHISASKSVHICTFVTVTVHICTVIVVLYFIFLIIFSHTSQVIFSLFFINSLSLLHLTLFHLYLLYTIINSRQIIKIIKNIKQILDLDLNSLNPYGFLKSKSQTHQTHLQNHIIKHIYKYM